MLRRRGTANAKACHLDSLLLSCFDRPTEKRCHVHRWNRIRREKYRSHFQDPKEQWILRTASPKKPKDPTLSKRPLWSLTFVCFVKRKPYAIVSCLGTKKKDRYEKCSPLANLFINDFLSAEQRNISIWSTNTSLFQTLVNPRGHGRIFCTVHAKKSFFWEPQIRRPLWLKQTFSSRESAFLCLVQGPCRKGQAGTEKRAGVSSKWRFYFFWFLGQQNWANPQSIRWPEFLLGLGNSYSTCKIIHDPYEENETHHDTKHKNVFWKRSKDLWTSRTTLSPLNFCTTLTSLPRIVRLM